MDKELWLEEEFREILECNSKVQKIHKGWGNYEKQTILTEDITAIIEELLERVFRKEEV